MEKAQGVGAAPKRKKERGRENAHLLQKKSTRLYSKYGSRIGKEEKATEGK